ncbi:MAG: hypothetical protein LUO86_03425 [Methanomicrobiales archaeon]|nr:hypothetical protein [Methanomicrobiales archaeon]MDD1654543.1 hypothetical protein [Methanomicrobiales archaeon]
MAGRAGRDPFTAGSIHLRRLGDETYVISEDYSFKTGTYYRIVSLEVEGKTPVPSSRETLEAYVVPVCLARAEQAGIPVLPWEISDRQVPLPAILYGVHYFADPSEYSVVRDPETAARVVRFITNAGKYPFCYQPVGEETEIFPVTAIFGKTAGAPGRVDDLCAGIYRVFRLPLVNCIVAQTGDAVALSALAPVRYSSLSREERGILTRVMEEECHG